MRLLRSFLAFTALLYLTAALAMTPGQRVVLFSRVKPLVSCDNTTGQLCPGESYSATSLRTETDANGFITYAPNNLLLNSATLSTQNVTTSAINYILSFSGTGSVVATGTASFTLNGTGASNRVFHAFTATAGTFTLTVSGSVTSAQLEAVTYQTSPSPYNATTSSAYYGPAFDSNYPSAGYQGLRIEEQRTNLLKFSSDYTQSFWIRHAITVSTNSTTAPDGTNTAQLISESATTDIHDTDVAAGVTTTSGQPYSRTFYEKYDGRQWLAVNIFDTQSNLTFFDIQNGVVGNNASGNTASIQSIGNGWYKLSVERMVSSTTVFIGVQGAIANGSTSPYLGSAGWYQWGQDLELGANATSYIPTSASAVTRSADIVQATGTLAACYKAASESTEVQFTYTNPAANKPIIVSTTGDTRDMLVNSSGRAALFDTGSSPTELDTTTGSTTAGTAARFGSTYTSNIRATAFNGANLASDSNPKSAGATVYLGSDVGTGAFIDGYLQKIGCWNPNLQNNSMQQKSTVGPGPITWLFPSNDNFAIDERRKAA